MHHYLRACTKKTELAPLPPLDFELANGYKLSALNRWVKMAEIIPWDEFESEYAANFPTEKGAPAKSFRMALGALIIKEKLGISDRETVEQIRENPYLQYFYCYHFFSNEPFYLVAPGFLCVFMSNGQNNTCFWIEDNLQLYFEEINARKTYIKSSLNISIAPVIGLRSIIQQALTIIGA